LKGEKGFALVLTLIITALLVALTVEFVNEVYVDTSARQNFVDAQQASLLAESGVDGGIYVLKLNLAGQSYSSLLDPWAKPLEFEEEAGSIKVTIEDESAKLNLNQIVGPNGTFMEPYHEIATRLLKKLGLSPDLLDALADWIDENNEPRPGGAESSYYNTLKPPYAAKNGPLDTLEELALVKGFDAGTMNRLRPFVTIYPDMINATININTAAPEMLAALDEGMSDSLVKSVMDYRKTTPFKSQTDLASVAGLETIAQGLTLTTTAKGTVYRIRSQATVRETIRIIEAVVQLDGTVLYWREF
jgi:general secretion pathway protein K